MRKNDEYDINIYKALKKLPRNILGVNGITFSLYNPNEDNEMRLHHLAKKSHNLKVKDIDIISSILKHPVNRCKDPTRKNALNYYGTRKSGLYNTIIKIITVPDLRDKRTEYLISIFITNKIKT